MNRKAVSGIMYMLLLISMLTLAFNTQTTKAILTVHNIDTGEDFATIQEAIDDVDTLDRHTILVEAGIYCEHVTLDKSISLIGENRNNTIIDGNSNAIAIYANADDISITGFTVQNGTAYGIRIGYCSNVTVSRNIIRSNYVGVSSDSNESRIVENKFIENFDALFLFCHNTTIRDNEICNNDHDGIYLYMCQDCRIVGNNISKTGSHCINLYKSTSIKVTGNDLIDNAYGIILQQSGGIIIADNNIIDTHLKHPAGADGIRLCELTSEVVIVRNVIADHHYAVCFEGRCEGNNITKNTIKDNVVGIELYSADGNSICHNNILNNTMQVRCTNSSNVWDDGYPSGGNYWSDYKERYPNASEIDGSGIWDTPYTIDEDNQDNYPLMEPWTPLPRTIDELKTKVEELGSQGEIDNQGIVKSIIAKLNAAQKLVDKGKIDEAKSILEEDFIPQVQNLSGIHITPEAADILIQSAEYILPNL